MNFKKFALALAVITICGGLIWWGEQHNSVDMEHRHEPTRKSEVQANVPKSESIEPEEDKPLFYISTPFVSVGIL